MIVQFTLGFLTPRLDQKTLSLGQSVQCPMFSCLLLVLQPCSPLSDDPEVDDFRHVNELRY
jgi:hypothetical protein